MFKVLAFYFFKLMVWNILYRKCNIPFYWRKKKFLSTFEYLQTFSHAFFSLSSRVCKLNQNLHSFLYFFFNEIQLTKHCSRFKHHTVYIQMKLNWTFSQRKSIHNSFIEPFMLRTNDTRLNFSQQKPFLPSIKHTTIKKKLTGHVK